MVEKYISKNGDVAVLISGSYGAGWSTWNSEYAEDMLFDKNIVEMLLEFRNGIKHIHLNKEILKKIEAYAKEKYPKAYLGGLSDGLDIEWLKPGTIFRVHEYDGSESIWRKEDITEYCA